MSRVYNFGAGPATLPEPILQQAQEELLDWNHSGMSVMETSHRSEAFIELMAQAEQDLRELLTVPENYRILFLTAPARSQFAMVPMNLLHDKNSADYFDTGLWSHIAIEEATRYCKVNVVTSAESTQYTTIPKQEAWQLNPAAAYVHYTANETVNGVEFPAIPDVGEVPLVSDMTSCLLSRPIDVSKFGLIYAGAQKNIGPAGLTIVILREDLIGKVLPFTPKIYNYEINVENSSLYYTPCSFACYVAALNFKWLKQQGGVAAMETVNQRKANKLYQYIDSSNFYENTVDAEYRSIMNVVFQLTNSDLNETFLSMSEGAGLAGLKGHRLVGGMRASIYNAMPEAGVDRLIKFMTEFENRFN